MSISLNSAIQLKTSVLASLYIVDSVNNIDKIALADKMSISRSAMRLTNSILFSKLLDSADVNKLY